MGEMNRMAMNRNVNILYCGCKNELDFISYLERCTAVHKGQPLHFEYTKYQERQTKETIMSSDAVRYKKQKVPLIVLISQTFFDMIWLTTHKQTILSIISSYSNKKCVHVWLDVNESVVKRRSKALMRDDGHFRRIHAENLKQLDDMHVIGKLQEYLYSHSASAYSLLNNYAVDDEIEEMERNFRRAHECKSKLERDSPFGAELDEKIGSKEIARTPSMNSEEYDVEANRNPQPIQQGATSSNSTPGPKKKKKNGKKKADTSSIKLFSDLTDPQKKQIATYLDQGAGANWKQLAQVFSINVNDIMKAISTSPTASPASRLIELLNSEQPDLELLDFVQKCKQIMRTDVPEYIRSLSAD